MKLLRQCYQVVPSKGLTKNFYQARRYAFADYRYLSQDRRRNAKLVKIYLYADADGKYHYVFRIFSKQGYEYRKSNFFNVDY